VQIYATPQGRDLGAVAANVDKTIADTAREVPKGSSVVLLGQVQTMNSAFFRAAVRIAGRNRPDLSLDRGELPVVVRSVRDHHGTAGSTCRIVWMLFTTQTTLSVPALTGAIMCMGVATANSVLVISFARERYEELGDPIAAAIEAGFVRFRPRSDDPRWR